MTLYGLNLHHSFPFMGSQFMGSKFMGSNFKSPLLSPFAPLASPPPPPPSNISKSNFVRITFNCGGYSPKSIKTDVYGTKVVISGKEEARIDGENYSVKEFKRSYELPVNADSERLASFMAPNGQLLIEVPLKQLPAAEESPNKTKVMAKNNEDSGSSFSFTYQLPENIDISKLNVTCRDRELTIHTLDNTIGENINNNINNNNNNSNNNNNNSNNNSNNNNNINDHNNISNHNIDTSNHKS